MPRIKVELPDAFPFTTELDVRITDINYGQHLANHALLGLLHEARVRCLAQYQFTEVDIDGVGCIMVDTSIAFKHETFYGARLAIDVAVDQFHKRGCDFVYRVRNPTEDTEVARARTGIVFFDYTARKMAPVPPRFKSAFES